LGNNTSASGVARPAQAIGRRRRIAEGDPVLGDLQDSLLSARIQEQAAFPDRKAGLRQALLEKRNQLLQGAAQSDETAGLSAGAQVEAWW